MSRCLILPRNKGDCDCYMLPLAASRALSPLLPLRRTGTGAWSVFVVKHCPAFDFLPQKVYSMSAESKTGDLMNIAATRLLNAIWALHPPVFGTLWWIPNEYWKKSPSFVLKKEQSGGSHPGVSLHSTSRDGLKMVPVLLGTSRKCTPSFAVQLNDTQEKRTYFETLRANFETENFNGSTFKHNPSKNKLSDSDCRALEQYIRNRLKWDRN